MFEMMWLSYPSLHNCVKDWWDVKIDGTTLFSVAKKLRIVKEKIIKWNKEMFGDIFMLKSAPQVDLNIIKDKIHKEGYVGDNFARESDIVSKFHSIISREEISGDKDRDLYGSMLETEILDSFTSPLLNTKLLI